MRDPGSSLSDQASGSFGLCGTTCVSVAVEAGGQLRA